MVRSAYPTLPLTTMSAGSSLLQRCWPARTFWQLSLLGLTFLSLSCHAAKLGSRDFRQLSSKAVASLVASPDPVRNVDPHNINSHLSKILIPRAPDTDNNTVVREYIVKTMKKLDWHVEEDSFTDTTPYGVKRFTNIIATKDPKAPRRVILSAHFDSKFFSSYPENQACTFGYTPDCVLTDVSGSSSLALQTPPHHAHLCWTWRKLWTLY